MAAIARYQHYPHLQTPAYLVSSPRGPVTFMANTLHQTPLPKLAQSRSKTDFFNHLGWSERDDRHKQLYNLMKEEASEARKSLSAQRDNLNQEARNDATLRPPYSSSQMTETALYNEVLSIWRNASPQTRPIYDLGQVYEQGNLDNWIIRWVLWHVFRYRDTRNRGRNGRPSARESSASSAGSPTSPNEALSLHSHAATSPSRPYYDPARDTHHRH